MFFRLAADAVVLTHFAFVLFVVFGGFLVIRWKKLAWVHLPIAIYGATIELVGWICPLTPLENHLRRLAGEAGYEGGFVEHYIMRILYPEGLTPSLSIVLGVGVVVINVVAYWLAQRK
jgi:hypothetical protein